MQKWPARNSSRDVHLAVAQVTERITRRSKIGRLAYLERVARLNTIERPRHGAGCANLAHGVAACAPNEKNLLARQAVPNIAIVSAYNDMLSAHQPLERHPALLKKSVLRAGGVAQFAGGVPAMCDGVTQGRAGMELSLFSRDVVAMATAIALAHDMFDGMLLLGVCDKIVPGLVVGALSFGHLPCILVPAGPMPSGISNAEKARVRQQHAQGQVDEAQLLESELAAYHAPGTCTFFGTANTNQLPMEAMGLHLPGASFIAAGTPLRRAVTEAAGERIVELTTETQPVSIAQILDEKAFVNAVVALLATGGSTNHTMHLVAMAAAAGIELTWQDIAELSSVVPLLARIYPNGSADINQFQEAGGTAHLFAGLLDAGLMHEDVHTVAGHGISRYCTTPALTGETLTWTPMAGTPCSRNYAVLRTPGEPFASDSGLRVLNGNLGRSVVKVSALKSEHRVVEAPARIFDRQEDFLDAFAAGELESDAVLVVRFQGPKANGMPELHRLTPALGVLQDRGQRVALITDGRMSGASGKVPAAVHCTPEAADGGPLSRLRNGDTIRFDTITDRLEVIGVDISRRTPASPQYESDDGTGRELFRVFRQTVGGAESGASVFNL